MNPTDLTVICYVGILFAGAWQSGTVLVRAWQGRRA